MDKPRLSVRLAVALIAFIIGITATLLVNYLWPRSHATQPAGFVFVTTRLTTAPPPQTLAPCAGHATVQPAFVWTPADLPAPPAPPAAPQPPARMRVRR